MKYVIFTDIDGTLIDKGTYSYERSADAVDLLKKNNIPLILCTSKTRAEIEHYRNKLGINDPFISENGGALFIPKDYFSFKYDYSNEIDDYYTIEMGTSYEKLRAILDLIRNEGVNIVGFGDYTVKELAEEANYDVELAKLAKKRDYDEPFKIISAHIEEDEKIAFRIIKENNIDYTKGDRFYHIKKGNDQKKLVETLIRLYKKNNKIKTAGIGDEINNENMLKAVDEAYVVKKKDSSYAKIKNAIHTKGIGPDGFTEVVKKIVK